MRLIDKKRSSSRGRAVIVGMLPAIDQPNDEQEFLHHSAPRLMSVAAVEETAGTGAAVLRSRTRLNAIKTGDPAKRHLGPRSPQNAIGPLRIAAPSRRRSARGQIARAYFVGPARPARSPEGQATRCKILHIAQIPSRKYLFLYVD